MSDAQERSGSLRLAAVSGAKWTSLSAAVSIGALFIQVAVLAQLLDPRDFGLAASLVVLIGLANAFGDMGISQAIIAKQTTEQNQLSSLYWVNVLAGVVICAALLAATPLVTAYYQEPGLATLMPIAAGAFLVAPIGQQFQALLQKELDFQSLARIEVVAGVAGPVAAITLAAFGVGAAAILMSYFVTQSVKALLLARKGWARWRPGFRLRFDDLRGYLSFGLYQMGMRISIYLGSNVDYILIGRFLGLKALGIYTIAYQLVVVPQIRLNPILTRVAFPLFARRQDDNAAIRRGFLELTRLVSTVAFPLMVGLVVTAPYLVPAVFGPEWKASVPIVQIEAILGALFALSNPQGSVFLGKDRPDIGFKINLIRLFVLTGALYVAVHESLVAVAWAYVGVVAVLFVVTRVVLQRLIGMSWSEDLAAVRKPALMAALMGLSVLAFTAAIGQFVDEDGVVLALQVGIGGVVYALLIAMLDRTYARRMWALFAARGASPG